jgi:ABC-type transport system substrate-binding protein
MSLVANLDYHGGRPHLDRVEILFFTDDENDSGTERFLRREVDLVEPAPRYMDELASHSGINTRRYPELSLSFLGFGIRNFPVDRKEVRQAIAHALNREVLLADLPMFRREAVGLMPPGLAGYSPSRKVLPYDPERARELLKEAGYTAENPLPPVPLYTASLSDAAMSTLERIRADLEMAGIRLDVRQVSWGELDRRITDGEAPAFLLAMIAGLTDADSYLRGFFDYDEAWQLFGFRDEECERLLEKGALEADPLESAKTYRELERMILERAPLVPLYHTVGILSSWKNVHGLEMGPAGLAKVRFEKVWIEEGGLDL